MAELSLLKRYKSNEEGGLAVVFSVVLMSSFMLLATTMDLMLLRNAKAKLQLLADTAALHAVKSYDGEQNQDAYFSGFLNAVSTYDANIQSINTRSVSIVQDEGRVSLKATVTAPVKLSFLQGVFPSKTISAYTEAEAGIENIEIALVLDISSSMNGARITEAKRAATTFVEQILEDENLTNRASISLVPYGGTVRVPKELSYLLTLSEGSDAYEDFSEHWIGGAWNQCFEYRATQVKAGIDQSETYEPTVDFWSWNQTNPWCPLAGNEFVPLTNDVEKLKAGIDSFTLSDGTGSDHGMMWGFETLNHDWLNKMPGGLADTPAQNDGGTKKVIIFMSDGGITNQHFVRDQDQVGDVPYNSRRKQLSGYSRTNALEAYLGICDKAREQDIDVYTIGFQLRRDREVNEITACATTPAHYFDAASGDLEGIFASLASIISPVRLSN